jgi:glycosyltransferase involved in cell wall biosynthesis
MHSLGLVDSSAIRSGNAGTQRHIREILKRLSKIYHIYYLPPIYREDLSEESLKEVKKYAKIPSFFESLLDRKPKVPFLRGYFTPLPLAKEMEREYKKEIGYVDFSYIPDANRRPLISSIFISSRISKGNYGMFLPADTHDSILEKQSFFECINTWNKILSSFKSSIELCLTYRLQDLVFLRKTAKNKPKFIGVENKGALSYTNLPKYFNVKVIIPPHAFNSLALKYRNFSKEDYVVFLGEIVHLKGAYDAIEIGKHVKLKMIGFKVKDSIVKEAERNGIEVRANIPEQEKFEILSKAKALVLPSHHESFSITILESLAVGTPVITYDLPSLTSTYKFKPVFFVKEFDVEGIIKKAKEMIKMSNKQIEEMFSNDELNKFLELHSSWDNVANAIDSLIRNFV